MENFGFQDVCYSFHGTKEPVLDFLTIEYSFSPLFSLFKRF